MKMFSHIAILALLLDSSLPAQERVILPAQDGVTRGSGGSIKTDLGYGIMLNEKSSLEREWITIHDDSILANLIGTVGVRTVYESGKNYSSASLRYKVDYKIVIKEPLAAIEVRFLTFDIWGDHVNTLSTTEIVHMETGENPRFDAEWNIFSDNETIEHYASIAWIAKVRTKSGRVIKADHKKVLDEAVKFSKEFEQIDLEPKPKDK